MKRYLSLAGLLLLSGCYKIDYSNGAQSGVSQDFWRHRVVYGIVEFDGPLQLDEVCPDGFTHIHTEISLPNAAVPMLISAFTGLGWLYTPSTIQVWCKSGQAYRAEVDGDGLVHDLYRMDPLVPEPAQL